MANLLMMQNHETKSEWSYVLKSARVACTTIVGHGRLIRMLYQRPKGLWSSSLHDLDPLTYCHEPLCVNVFGMVD